MKLKKSILLKSFVVSFLYVGFGTFSLLGMYPASPFYWEWSALGILITVPVSAFGFIVMFTEGNDYLMLLIQSVVLLVLWLIVYRIWMKKIARK